MEEWKSVEGYEGLYSVSNLGRVYSHKKGRTLKLQTSQHYCTVMLWRGSKYKNARVNRLVATAFIPNPTSLPEVNHIDTVKGNNRWDNLEWTTHKGNLVHAADSGLLDRRGKREPGWTIDQVSKCSTTLP